MGGVVGPCLLASQSSSNDDNGKNGNKKKLCGHDNPEPEGIREERLQWYNAHGQLSHKQNALRQACAPVLGAGIAHFNTAEFRTYEENVWLPDDNYPVGIHFSNNKVVSLISISRLDKKRYKQQW